MVSELKAPRKVKMVDAPDDDAPDVSLPVEVRLEIAERMYRETCYSLEVLRANTSLKSRLLKSNPSLKETVQPQLDKLAADAETTFGEATILWADVKALRKEAEAAKQRRAGSASLSVVVEKD